MAAAATKSTGLPKSCSNEFLEAEKGVSVAAGRYGLELDEEIEIAARRIEILARRRAEKVEPPHVETAAQFPQFLAVR